MNCPDFVCMGFQKCGTTTLYEILKQHPRVVLCRDVKEPMYYRVPRFIQIIGHGHTFYRWRYFGHVKRSDPRMRGEINAGLTFTHCEKKLYRNLSPDVKMIFMMRNPADRCYSAYKYFLARGFLPGKTFRDDQARGHAKAFDRYVHQVLDNPKKQTQIMDKRLKYLVFSQNNYAQCVSEYMQDFRTENMKFVIFEEFVQDQHAACLDIYDFLGLTDDAAINYRVRANEGKDRALSFKKARWFLLVKTVCQYALYEFAAMPRWAPKTYSHVKNYYRKTRNRCLVRDEDNEPMLPQTRVFLMEYYQEEISAMGRIMGRDLHEIWK